MRPLALVVCSLAAIASEPAVTVYNGGFAVVRDRITVGLGQGPGVVSYAGASAHVEPGTAMIAMPAGVQVLEHTYRNDPASVGRLLQLFEGQTIDVEVLRGDQREVCKARIVRAPATVHQEAWQRFGQAYAQRQQAMYYGGLQGANEVLLEMDGQLRFGLPGTPLFPALPAGTDLRPTLEWQVRAGAPVQGQAEISYLCDGMRWDAAYTVVAGAGDEDAVDFNGVISVENQCGTAFTAARLKFVAGDVMKVDADGNGAGRFKDMGMLAARAEVAYDGIAARAEGKAFSDYHIYTMPDPVDLHDRETKQLGFLDAKGVASRKVLVYDGQALDWNQYRGWNADALRSNREFGQGCTTKVVVERVIANKAENKLGKPLPAGVVRFYLKDSDGRPEFVGENTIDHTPEGETLRVRTGNAFDLVGERTQTDFTADTSRRFCDETFRNTLRNHRATPAAVTVVEHLHRSTTWELRTPSTAFTKRDSSTIEFPVIVPPKGETVVTYQVHYTW